ncbi:MAG: cation:proton antiporter [Plesiomonas sp.]|uniref:cation:proton antiporter n=1 Tax=Plesiomonas sp. TaxID=2486279 RepID=UPI003F37ACEF
MSVYYTLCFLAAIAIMIAYLNQFISKVQTTIAITAGALLCSLILIIAGHVGWFNIESIAQGIVEKIDFQNFLLKGILGFLLFAGALGIKLPVLKDQKWEITVLALFSTLFSTFLIGFATYGITHLIGINMAFIHCLLFGALISPTDPIAVLAIIKKLNAPRRVSMQVEGESLFNDGVGLVIFVTIFAVSFGGRSPTFLDVSEVFLHEALGGIVYGLVIGYIAHLLICATDDGSLEQLITLLVPTAGFALANMLGVSGALAMVVAGIMVGNWTRYQGFSEQSSRYMDHFWEMIDHFLNALLFLLIGLCLLLIDLTPQGMLLMLLAIPVCLLARYISVAVPFIAFRRFRTYNPYTLKILTWGGLRGGLALAMALSIPAGTAFVAGTHTDVRDLILVMTYAVVLFSILIQGSSIERMIIKSKSVEPSKKEHKHPNTELPH